MSLRGQCEAKCGSGEELHVCFAYSEALSLVVRRKEGICVGQTAKQILRSGTSVGANVEEAIGGHSERDFHSKMTIAYKEIRETHYWLRLLHDSNYIEENAFQSFIADCEELTKILGSITKTMKNKMNS